MGGAVRLDLGSGHKHEAGWVAVDFDVERRSIKDGAVKDTASPIAPDVVADLRCLPFPDDYADEARAIHVIEHFQVWEASDVLAEWVRVLKPGGMLTLECPCLDKIIALMAVPKIRPHMTMWGLYGDPRLKDPLMMHHWCYTEKLLAGLMQEVGLVKVFGETPRFHQPDRDMRLCGFKPESQRVIVQ